MRYKNFLFIFLIVSSVFFLKIEVKALEIVDLNPIMQKGEIKDIELYVNAPIDTKQINFSLIFFSYDVIGTFKQTVGVLTNNGTLHSIDFEKPISGRVKLGTVQIIVSENSLINIGSINLNNANAIMDGQITKLNNQSIQVNIHNEQIEEVKTNLLKTIGSNIVDISLEPNKYEYELLVNNEVDKLDLTATAIDETYAIDITDQNLKEGKNQIFINVSKGTISEKYTINVTREEKVEELEKNKDKLEKNKVSKIKNKSFKFGWTGVMVSLIVVFIIALFMLKKNKIIQITFICRCDFFLKK